MSSAEDWARDFFTGIFVELWLKAIPPEQTRAEADFLVDVLSPPAGGRILDVPCGGGRHAVELAGRGYRVTGVDLSGEFLTAARQGAATASVSVDWRRQPMHELPWAAEFDGALCMGNSLGGLDTPAMHAFFAAVAAALKPGARFVVETGIVAEALLPHLEVRPWWRVGDIVLAAHNTYNAAASRLHTDFTLVRDDGTIERKQGFSEVHTLREFAGILRASGFGTWQAYASIAKDSFVLGSRELLLVASTAEGM